jgi:cell division protein FtsN
VNRNDDPERTVYELTLELNLTKGVLLLSLALAIVFVAFLAGRASVETQADVPATLSATPASELETNDASVFDRSESSRGARFELDLGEYVDRAAAEARRQAATRSGVAAMVVQQSNGKFRVAAGPFESDQQARQAARRLDVASPIAVRKID